jgi:hypothetical protein
VGGTPPVGPRERGRACALGLLALALLWVAATAAHPASAQRRGRAGRGGETPVNGANAGEPAGAAGPSDAEFEASLRTSNDDASPPREPPTILVVAERGTSRTLVRTLSATLESAGRLVDADDYVREARSRGLPPERADAMAEILPRLQPELDLVVVVGTGRLFGMTTLTVRYHDRFGLEMLREEHVMRGGLPDDALLARVLAETRLALAVITRPPGGLRQVSGVVAPEPGEVGAAVHVAMLGGAGFGTRDFSVPGPLGVISLRTSAFPAAMLGLAFDVEPTARGRLGYGADVAYTTSFGLVTRDERIDGTQRDTAARSHHLQVGARVWYRLGESLEAVSLHATLGYSVLAFSSEAPVTLPRYALQGPCVSVAVTVPVGERVTLAFAPELRAVLGVGEGLTALGVSGGVGLGASASVRLRLLDDLGLELHYRESHALLSTTSPEGATDVERFATVRAVYRR